MSTDPMSLPEPFRGEVWNVDFDEFGIHPVVVLSVNPLNARLGHVAVIPVTGTRGPEQTHVPLTADAGLTRCDEFYADVTALQPVARTQLLERRGLLTRTELVRPRSQAMCRRTAPANNRQLHPGSPLRWTACGGHCDGGAG